ncbi:MAG: hypothetical protein V1793_17035 [Pseudomonadota bacterium]
MNIKANTSILYLVILGLVLLGSACQDKGDGVQGPSFQEQPESFAFFDVGVNTRLSSHLRSTLTQVLGDESTQGNNVIDLAINYPEFLTAHFPELDELNKKLNYPPRERVEHKTTRLMFRYASVKGLDFSYVEILFSDYTQSPLLIRVNYKSDNPEVLKTLTDKYGDPVSIAWEKEGGPSFAWRQNNDLLILSLVPDQFGNPTSQIFIVFEKRLVELLATEEAESLNRKAGTPARGKTPF